MITKNICQAVQQFIKKVEFPCKMNPILANSNDATTGHKLQGMTKDVIVVTSQPTGGLAAMFKNWEYIVLSRVCTLSGLYLVEPIDMEKLFKPSSELKKYMETARQKEMSLLKNLARQQTHGGAQQVCFQLKSTREFYFINMWSMSASNTDNT